MQTVRDRYSWTVDLPFTTAAGSTGVQHVVVEAHDEGQAVTLAVRESTTANAVRHRRGGRITVIPADLTACVVEGSRF
ncbi:hypothetical protein ACFVXQ_33855 [Kitasatospora sp. NPDC058263]